MAPRKPQVQQLPTQPHTRSLRKRTHIAYAGAESSGDEDGYESTDSSASVIVTKKRKVSINSNKPLPKKKIFPFLSLPAELRNVIYSHCLTDDFAPIYLASKTKSYRRVVRRDIMPMHFEDLYQHRHNCLNPEDVTELPERGIKSLIPNILCLNRQIYAEAGSLLYSNEIVLEDTTALHAFLANLTPDTQKMLKHLALLQWGYGRTHKGYNHTGLTLLVGCTNLQSLSIHAESHVRWRYNRNAEAGEREGRQFFRDGFHWLEAVARRDGVERIFEILGFGVHDYKPYSRFERDFLERRQRSVGPFRMSSAEEEEGFKRMVRKLLCME